MSLKKWSIRRRINAGFASITLIALAFGFFSIVQLAWIKSDTAHITGEILPAMDRAGNLAEQFQALGDKSDVLFIKEIMSPSDDMRAELASQIQTNLQSGESLAKEYAANVQDADEKNLLANFQSTLAAYEEIFRRGVALCAAGKSQDAMELKEAQLEPALDKLMTSVHKLESLNRSKGEAAGGRIQAAVEQAQKALWTGVIGLLLAAGAVSLVIIITIRRILNHVAESLGDTARKMTYASQQVADASQTVASNATEQATSIEQVSASLEHMIRVSKENADHAQTATNIAQQTHATAANGSKNMAELDGAVQEMNAANSDIAKIVRTIDEIAFQTNILALNAAVEAARAGAAGMGFAVVAEEVRNLAQRSAQGAKETANRIEATVNKAAKGAELSKRLAGNFQEIVAHVREVDQIDQKLASISKEQAAGIAQINIGVSRLDKLTQSNAAHAKESSATAAALSNQTEDLKHTVAQLLQLIGSNSRGDGHVAVALNGHTNGAVRNGKATVPHLDTVST